MNLVHKLTLSVASLFLTNLAIAQTGDPAVNTNRIVNADWQNSLVPDGVIDRVEHDARLIATPRIREIDVAWKRRVWRVIDVRQKANQAFIYRGDEFSGGGAFIEILLHGVKNKDLEAYTSDRFTAELTTEAFEDLTAGAVDSTSVIDPITGGETIEVTTTVFNPQSVTKYRLKEDWILDRNRGKMIVQIIGISPLRAIHDPSTGQYLTDGPMFWVYYPDARLYLSKFEVYNPRNDMKRLSWADYLDMRYFTSYVYKTNANNPQELSFEKGLRGLEEGEQAMQDIYNKAMNMWEN